MSNRSFFLLSIGLSCLLAGACEYRDRASKPMYVLTTTADSLPPGKHRYMIMVEGDTFTGRQAMVGEFGVFDDKYRHVAEASLSVSNGSQDRQSVMAMPYYIIIVDGDTARSLLRFDCEPSILPLPPDGMK